MKKNNHEYYELLISRDKDNDLNNIEKDELKQHLCNCTNCREFNAKINKLSSLVNLEVSPVFVTDNKEMKGRKIYFGYRHVFSVAAAVLVFVGVGIFLNNNENKKAMNGDDFLAKIEITNTTTTDIIATNTEEDSVIAYGVKAEYDNQAPLAIFFDDYNNEVDDRYTDNYSKPMQAYLTYSLSDSK